MEKIKYCPKCKAAHDIHDKACKCGYQFVETAEEATTKSNVVAKQDKSNPFIWSLIAFVCFPFGIYGITQQEEYPNRAQACKKGLVTLAIVAGIAIVVFAYLYVMKEAGKIQ